MVEERVKEQYLAKHPGRADWADWMYAGHVFLVADKATELAERFGANAELSRAAALLHDLADSVMKRDDERHEEETDKMAKEILEEAGFTEVEMEIVIGDAIANHSCYDGNAPKSPEGKVLATADSCVHLAGDFYLFATYSGGKEGKELQKIKAWALSKIERDWNDKLQFEEVKQEMEGDYRFLKKLFGS